MTLSIAFIVGVVLILFALLALLVVAFRTDLIWGVLGLLVLPLLIFMLLYPGKTKFLQALLVIGVVTSGLALWGGADQMLNLKARAEALGIAELPGINLLREPPPIEEAVVEEAPAPEEEAVVAKEKPKAVVEKPKPRSQFREVSAGELPHLVGGSFRGETYDGRSIEGRILEANGGEVVLSRSVSMGGASFTFRVEEFKSMRVAGP